LGRNPMVPPSQWLLTPGANVSGLLSVGHRRVPASNRALHLTAPQGIVREQR
jgi:hypothetical protein